MKGEFEKRIEQLERAHWAVNGDWITAGHIMKVIEDAKKEMPINGWLFGIKHGLSEEESLQLYEWFEKWFGTEEVKT